MADFFLDADVDVRIGDLLRARGHGVRLTAESSRLDATDDVQLLAATELGSLLLTHNRADYLLLHQAWHSLSRRWGVSPGDHACIIGIPQPVIVTRGFLETEIHNLVGGQPALDGKFVVLDAKWGWYLEP